MTNWLSRIDISDIHKAYEKGEIQPNQVCAKVAERMEEKRNEVKSILDKFRAYNMIDIWDDISGNLKYMGNQRDIDTDDYDTELERLYDLADTRLSGSFISGEKLCWVNTF